MIILLFFFFFQAEDGIRDAQESRGLGDVYKRQVLDPPSGLPVDTTPFYNPETDTCMAPCESCYETCNPDVECNECDGISGSCEKVAKIFSLTVECFQRLNPHVDCGEGLKGQTFCQGSGCPLHEQMSIGSKDRHNVM
eukprot:TRINITY_DN18262_c0_g1_i1.p1 TRINITY_DN18262_c0_g1~~TRINITY_DN18262_c0_g1_i1.p1  ORF type:complete len:138 (+),score=31.94 TRINITY_DN18262_c0_g1_i1:116-529(+)